MPEQGFCCGGVDKVDVSMCVLQRVCYSVCCNVCCSVCCSVCCGHVFYGTTYLTVFFCVRVWVSASV